MFRVALGWALDTVFLGCQDISPSVDEQVLFGLNLLLFLFQAPCGGDEPPPEAFLFEGFLWDYEIFVTCRRSGNGGPQTCLPAACGMAQVGAQRGPSSSAQAQDHREGPSLAGRRYLCKGHLARCT